MQTRMRRRWSHASNRYRSRSPRRSRQAITNASCRASSARSTSRRIRWAIAYNRSLRVEIRSTNAALSPPWAARTRSEFIVPRRWRSSGAPSDIDGGQRVAGVHSSPGWAGPDGPASLSSVLRPARLDRGGASMAELYPWFVVIHLVGLVLFAVSHGASAFMAFRIRGERDPAVVDALLKVGQLSVGPMYIGLVLLSVGGLGAAAGAKISGDSRGSSRRSWCSSSCSSRCGRSRPRTTWACARRSRNGVPDGRPSIDPAALAVMLDTRRPEPDRRGNRRAPDPRLADGHQARLRPAIARPPWRSTCMRRSALRPVSMGSSSSPRSSFS